MAIGRTADVDDSGAGIDGTIHNNAWKTQLYDQIDAAPGTQTVLAARTDTGAVNNWAPALVGNTYIPWNGAADVTISGLAGGVAGQLVTVKNITAAKVANFLHASGLSSAANQFNNYATSGATSIAPGGSLIYQHNGTAWQLVTHEQGAWITPTFAAGNFTANGAMTWTVVSGNIAAFRYWLKGRQLTLSFDVGLTTIGGTANTQLLMLIPGGFTAAGTFRSACMGANGGGVAGTFMMSVAIAGTQINLMIDRNLVTNWTLGAAAIHSAVFLFEVQ